MILLVFQTTGGPALGIKTEQGVIDIKAAAKAFKADVPDTPAAFYAQGLNALLALEVLITSLPESGTWLLDEATLVYGPCVPTPEKILCWA